MIQDVDKNISILFFKPNYRKSFQMLQPLILIPTHVECSLQVKFIPVKRLF